MAAAAASDAIRRLESMQNVAEWTARDSSNCIRSTARGVFNKIGRARVWRICGATAVIHRRKIATSSSLIRSTAPTRLPTRIKVRMDRPGILPVALGIAIGEIERQRGRMRVDDDFAASEALRAPARPAAGAPRRGLAAATPGGCRSGAARPASSSIRSIRTVPTMSPSKTQHVRVVSRFEFVRVGLVISLPGRSGAKIASRRMA